MGNTDSFLEKIDGRSKIDGKSNVIWLFTSTWELNSNTDHIYDRSSKDLLGFNVNFAFYSVLFNFIISQNFSLVYLKIMLILILQLHTHRNFKSFITIFNIFCKNDFWRNLIQLFLFLLKENGGRWALLQVTMSSTLVNSIWEILLFSILKFYACDKNIMIWALLDLIEISSLLKYNNWHRASAP